MRWLHLVVGIVSLVGFLLTGQYMDLVHDHLRGMDDSKRLLFRSSHIYLLFCSLLNLVLGLYYRSENGWRRWVQLVGSLLILLAPFLEVVGFFTEHSLTELQRPYSRLAIFGCLAGVLAHWTTMSSRKPTQ